MSPCRKRQTPTYLQEITKKFEAKYLITLHRLGGEGDPCCHVNSNYSHKWWFQKKGAESPDAWHDLGHRVIEGVRQRNVTTCKIIAVVPRLPALGGFNRTKMVNPKPIFFFLTL